MIHIFAPSVLRLVSPEAYKNIYLMQYSTTEIHKKFQNLVISIET